MKSILSKVYEKKYFVDIKIYKTSEYEKRGLRFDLAADFSMLKQATDFSALSVVTGLKAPVFLYSARHGCHDRAIFRSNYLWNTHQRTVLKNYF